MAISDVDIANLALTKLGSLPIVSFLDSSNQARAINRSYKMLRDKLQRRRWNFNRVYIYLPVLTDLPTFEYQYAYALPADYLRLELASQVQPTGQPPPGQTSFAPPISVVGMPGGELTEYNNARNQDYRIVGRQIWSNFPPPLGVVYGRREEDPNKFDSFFVEALAAYIAWQLCETITNSDDKKKELRDEFRESMMEALTAKAIELPPEIIPDDTWMMSRISS